MARVVGPARPTTISGIMSHACATGPATAPPGGASRPRPAPSFTARQLRELVAVLLGEGPEPRQHLRIRGRRSGQRHAPPGRLLEEAVHPTRGEDQQHPGRLRPRVGGPVRHAPGHHHEGAGRGQDPARARAHGQLPLQDVEGLLVAAVEVWPGTRGAGGYRVVVDGVGASGVGVPDLDHHRPTDRVRENLAVGRADEDAPVLGPHAHAPRSLATGAW